MRYLLVIDQIKTGGAERILLDYFVFLKNQGYHPTIFALSGTPSQSEWTKDIEVIYGSESSSDNLLAKTYEQISLLNKLTRLINRLKPEVIFSFLEKSNLLTVLTPGPTRKIVTVHNLLSIQYQKIKSQPVRKVLYWMLQKAYNGKSTVITVSEQVKKDLSDNFGINPGKIHVINNRVDKDEIIPKSRQHITNFSFREDTKYILNVGRFSAQKAQWRLIKAFAYLQKDQKEKIELLFLGEGEEQHSLEQLARDLGISDTVHFLPFDPNPYKYMAKSDLFVLSSNYEGFPIVIAETAALGIPFVGSSSSIPKEIFDNEKTWTSCTFPITNYLNDPSTTVNDDIVQLANLMHSGLLDQQFRRKLLASVSSWNQINDKTNQFKAYLNL